MRSTALITLISSGAMAASESINTGNPTGEGPAYNSMVYAPPVTTTITETETQYDTISSYETTVTAYHTAYELVPPVTATVTKYVGELYDQSYGNGFELGDIIVAPTVITETKTFTLAGPGGDEENTSLTKLVNEWSIAQTTPYATTVTQYTSTTWIHEHITSTIWVDAAEPTEESTTTIIELEDGYGGLEEPEPTGSKFHVIDLPDNDETTPEELEKLKKLLTDIWETEQAAAEKAAQEAAKKFLEDAEESSSATVSPTSVSQVQAHKPSRPHGPTPTHRPTSFHSPSPSKAPTPSTFATKPSAQVAPRPQSSVAAGKWKGKLINTPNGTCGPKGGQIAYTCQGNSQGSCCSAYGHCGSGDPHCGTGCMSAFGTCSPLSLSGNNTQSHPHSVVKRSGTPDSDGSDVSHKQKIWDLLAAFHYFRLTPEKWSELEVRGYNMTAVEGVLRDYRLWFTNKLKPDNHTELTEALNDV